jgi:hypothetical protein
MKHFTFFVLFLSSKAFAQEWIDYYHDSTLIVSMPYYHYEREQNGIVISTAKVEDGVIVVSHIPPAQTTKYNISDSLDLRRSYQAIREGLMESQGNILLKCAIIERDGLKWMHFVVRGSPQGTDQLVHNLIVFVNDRLYTLTYFEMGPSTTEKDEVRTKIFSSARIADGIPRSQVSSKLLPPFPYIRFLIFLMASIVVIVGFVVSFFKRRSKKEKRFFA